MSKLAAHTAGNAVAIPPPTERLRSLTYEPYFGLREKPFGLSADPRFLYRSRSHGPAFDDLAAAIRRREGLIVLTGDIGTGKTTLCRAVLGSLDRRTFSAFVADPFVSREDLLKMLLIDFGVMSMEDLKAGRLQGATRQELSYRLYEFLDSLAPLQAFAVLVIDEAQNLSVPLLEEIRILSDLEDREKLLQVVLVGQPELRSRLKLPQMRQVDQRISMRCELAALGREAVTSYVEHRLNVAGGDDSSVRFTAGSLDVVFHASAGVPRLINLICDRALHEGHNIRTRKIESAIVWKALGALGLDVSPTVGDAEARFEAGLLASAGPAEGAAPIDALQREHDPGPPPAAALAPSLMAPAEYAPPIETPRREHHAGPTPAEVLQNTPAALDSLAEFRSETEEPGEADPLDRADDAKGRRRSARACAVVAIAVVVLLSGVAGGGWYARDAAGTPTPSAGLPEISGRPIPLAPPGLQFAGPPDVLPLTVSPEADPATSGGAYLVQVASFESHWRATRLVDQLTRSGYRAYQVEVYLGPARGRLVQVFVGEYERLLEAELALAAIRRIPGYADARIRPSGTGRN